MYIVYMWRCVHVHVLTCTWVCLVECTSSAIQYWDRQTGLGRLFVLGDGVLSISKWYNELGS